ncbi:MAG: hypothetical protein ACHQUC_08775, partial [Chlamydiales bacterium]
SGIYKKRFYEKFQEPIENRFLDLLQAFGDEGLINIDNDTVKLTPRGRRFSSHIGHFIARQFGGEDASK